MKRILKFTAAALILVLGSSLRNNVSAQDYDEYDDRDNGRDVSYQTFYDELSPHGRWIDYPEHGYVWVPNAGADFRPYSTNGRWVWTDDYDWMWASDYDWGWAPFHYGRWAHDPYYGWYWVPGYEWSPAWVAWRDGGDYYGWAPLRPGINISINFNIGGYSPPYDYWSFAPRRYITSRNIFSHCIDYRRNSTIIYQTTIINNFNYNRNIFRSGPRRYDAERYCGRINPVRFRETYRPGRTEFRNNEVSVYRPNIRRDDNRRFSPRQFDRYQRQGDGNRGERNENGFRRNDDNNRRNDNAGNRGNDQPVRREPGNNRFDRRSNNEVRQPQNNNLPDRRRVDRNETNNGQTNREGERRITRSAERPGRDLNQGNNNGNSNNRFERRNDNSGTNNSRMRQPEVRNNNNNNNRFQSQPRQQIEQRRQEQPRRQMEQRRQEQPRQQMEQPRQFERRNDGGNRQQGNGDGGNGRGNGRRRS